MRGSGLAGGVDIRIFYKYVKYISGFLSCKLQYGNISGVIVGSYI